MKIAVISDIHANLLALQKVLESIETFNPDKIFCLGDIILAGYNPNKTCEIIFNLIEKYKDNFEIIQGNTDKMVAFATSESIKKVKEAFPCMGYSLEEDIKITEKKYIDFVSKLPEKKLVEINGLKIELCHGSPRNQSENIYPELLDKTVCEMVESSKASLILCGHTHKPAGYSLSNGKTVINAGSVGRPMTKDKMPCYLELTIDDNGQYFTEHKIIKYDNELVSRHVLSRGFPFVEDLAKMYLV